jgi:hypothetical protein
MALHGIFLVISTMHDRRYRQLTIASLLARQAGLSETDRNLFPKKAIGCHY